MLKLVIAVISLLLKLWNRQNESFSHVDSHAKELFVVNV